MTKKKLMQEKTKYVDRRFERSELELLFVSAVEEVRKKIVQRKLTSELISRSVRLSSLSETKPINFEESLIKLGELVKDKVKLDDFTAQDKSNLLEYFFNTKEILLKISEMLFPGIKVEVLGAASEIDYSLKNPRSIT